MYLLFVCTLLGFISVYTTDLTKFILKFFHQIPEKERNLIVERNKLVREQAGLSISRDFVAHSKLQRKINSYDETLKEMKEERTSNSFLYKFAFDYGLKVLISACILYLTAAFRLQPLIKLSDTFDLWPFGGIISFPTHVHNSVSIPFWIICCSNLASYLKAQDKGAHPLAALLKG